MFEERSISKRKDVRGDVTEEQLLMVDKALEMKAQISKFLKCKVVCKNLRLRVNNSSKYTLLYDGVKVVLDSECMNEITIRRLPDGFYKVEMEKLPDYTSQDDSDEYDKTKKQPEPFDTINSKSVKAWVGYVVFRNRKLKEIGEKTRFKVANEKRKSKILIRMLEPEIINCIETIKEDNSGYVMIETEYFKYFFSLKETGEMKFDLQIRPEVQGDRQLIQNILLGKELLL